ncbi:MAG: hypothetical protein KBS55_03425 [Bacteroidales bacterium]|nr:hypothetical protein [Candidatus Cryptobacteroides aphodequi]
MIHLFSLTSPLHNEVAPLMEDPFVRGIEKALGERFAYCGEDFSGYEGADERLIYVRTGGTEGIFKSLHLNGEVRLLASGQSNSLAAAMEILSFVNASGGRGKIYHGSPAAIARQLRANESASARECRWIKPIGPEVNFDGARLGVIGRPSDWLIASDVDYAKAAERLGAHLIDIDIRELVDKVKKYPCDLRSFAGSEAIYSALTEIVREHSLDGLTLRCFDLLDTLGNTGCLALARLNAEGTVAGCEGDIPTLLTMMLAKKRTGQSGFQCNLSRISGNELLFAHCTVPLTMVTSFRYATHFESGIGTAIKGEMPEGPVSIIKISPDLEHMVEIPAELVRNTAEANLCRTQVVLRVDDIDSVADYFLSASLANHHVICGPNGPAKP